MQFEFKKFGTGQPVNLARIAKQLNNYKGALEIHLGTDSQNIGGKTIYATTLVVWYPGNGANVFYIKQKMPKVQDQWSRLWKEIEMSVEVGLYLKENVNFPIHFINMDYNTDENFPSSKVYKAAKGYAESVGFKAKAKPELMPATWAANTLCS